MSFGELSVGLSMQELTIPNHEIGKALHTWGRGGQILARCFHMNIVFSKTKQIYGHFIVKWQGRKSQRNLY